MAPPISGILQIEALSTEKVRRQPFEHRREPMVMIKQNLDVLESRLGKLPGRNQGIVGAGQNLIVTRLSGLAPPNRWQIHPEMPSQGRNPSFQIFFFLTPNPFPFSWPDQAINKKLVTVAVACKERKKLVTRLHQRETSPSQAGPKQGKNPGILLRWNMRQNAEAENRFKPSGFFCARL